MELLSLFRADVNAFQKLQHQICSASHFDLQDTLLYARPKSD